MGTYLATGIVQEIAIDKRRIKYPDIIVYNITQQLKNELNLDLISYFMDGKIIMECYGNILRYFEHNIRLQRDKYPIVDCIKVMITS